MAYTLFCNVRYYLLLSLLLFISTLKSQNPGGVTGEIIWNKASGNDTLVNSNSPQNFNEFNFNPTIEAINDTISYHNVLNEFYSLFVVFKADTLAESTIFEIESGNNTTKVTNEKMYKGNEVDFDKTKVKRGMILTYLTRQKDFSRKNKFSFEDFSMLMTNDGDNNQLLEVVYYPRFLTKKEKEKVETYLSVKYGISLEGEKNYISSSGDTIWNYENNSLFNHRVTGIGRDSISDLLQLQSGNAEIDGVFFQHNAIDTTNQNLSDKTFLLWGDNDGSTHIVVDTTFSGDYNKMDRVWKTQLTAKSLQDSVNTNLYIDLKNLDVGQNVLLSDSLFWVARSKSFNNEFDYYNAEYIKQSKLVDSIVHFENIPWDMDPTYFTLVSGPELFVLFDLEPKSCNQESFNNFNFKVVGGMPPYKVNITSENEKNEMIVGSVARELYLEPGESTLSVEDNYHKTITKSIKIEPATEEELPVILASKWFLDKTGETTIFPQVDNSKQKAEDLRFEWLYNDEIINHGEQLNTNISGKYVLIVTNKEGCYTELPFIVEENSQILNTIYIYPNPVQANENFNLVYTLDKTTDFQLKIYNQNGQLIKEKKFENTQWGNYQDFLKTSGSYLITTETHEGVQTFKIVVK